MQSLSFRLHIPEFSQCTCSQKSLAFDQSLRITEELLERNALFRNPDGLLLFGRKVLPLVKTQTINSGPAAVDKNE